MDTNAVQMLIQGGAVGLAAIAMWITYKLVSNHMIHVADAIKDLTSVLHEIKQVIIDKIK